MILVITVFLVYKNKWKEEIVPASGNSISNDETEVGLVTWSPVQYANGYFTEVFKDGVSIGAGGGLETSCNIKELIRIHGEGTYTVKIKAQRNVLPESEVVTTTYTI